MEIITIKDIARKLGNDIVTYEDNDFTSDPYIITMRYQVEYVLKKHQILFTGMRKKLKLDDIKYDTFDIYNIYNEMFKDKQYNWGRIIVIYAFAKELCNNNMDQDRKHIIGNIVGNYIADNLNNWIYQQGGWNNFIDSFPIEKTELYGLFDIILILSVVSISIYTLLKVLQIKPSVSYLSTIYKIFI